ncbi:MAG: hypothetical protein ACI4HI_03050 [Lachnospiraceae bacterium]
MAMNLMVGVMAVIVIAASVWCWWLDHQGNEDEKKADEIEQTQEKHSR